MNESSQYWQERSNLLNAFLEQIALCAGGEVVIVEEQCGDCRGDMPLNRGFLGAVQALPSPAFYHAVSKCRSNSDSHRCVNIAALEIDSVKATQEIGENVEEILIW